jgi:hypothetical protein
VDGLLVLVLENDVHVVDVEVEDEEVKILFVDAKVEDEEVEVQPADALVVPFLGW